MTATVNGEGRDRAIEMRNGFIISITISVSISNELLYDETIKIPSAFRQRNSRILISFVCQRTFGTEDERKRERVNWMVMEVVVWGKGAEILVLFFFALHIKVN